jgi:hypothetical protein
VQLGDIGGAESLLAGAVRELVQLKDTWLLVNCLIGLAGYAVARGETERAALLEGAADGLRERVGSEIYPQIQQLWAVLRSRLAEQIPAEMLEALRADGRALSPDELTGFLRLTDPSF